MIYINRLYFSRPESPAISKHVKEVHRKKAAAGSRNYFEATRLVTIVERLQYWSSSNQSKQPHFLTLKPVLTLLIFKICPWKCFLLNSFSLPHWLLSNTPKTPLYFTHTYLPKYLYLTNAMYSLDVFNYPHFNSVFLPQLELMNDFNPKIYRKIMPFKAKLSKVIVFLINSCILLILSMFLK